MILRKPIRKDFLLYIVCCAFIIVSCDPGEVDVPAWTSEFIFPIVEADFDIQDVTFSEGLMLREDSLGALTVVYVADKDTVGLLDLIKIPDQEVDLVLPKYPNDLSDFSFSINLSVGDFNLNAPLENKEVDPFDVPVIEKNIDISENFEQATFESGEISLVINNGFPFDINTGLIIELINDSDGAIFFSHVTNEPVPAGGTYTVPEPISLADRTAEGYMHIFIRDISSPGGENLTIAEDAQFGLSMTASNLKLTLATLSFPAFETDSLSHVLHFDLPYGARLRSALMRSGEATITLQQSTELPLTFTYSFPSIRKNGQVLEGQLSATSTDPQTINLDNTGIDFTDGGDSNDNTLRLNYFLSSTGTTQPVTIDFSQPLKAKLSIQNGFPAGVFGYLGYYTDRLKGELKIDIFKSVVKGSISFNDPKVLALIDNEFGVEAGLIDNSDLYIRARNPNLFPGEQVSLKQVLSNISIPAAEFPGDSKSSVVVMDGAKEPSFENFINLLPSEVSYSFPIAIGTSDVKYSQFALDTSTVIGNIQIELPLDLQSKNLTITDTLDLDFELDTEYTELVSGFLNTSVENYFPLEFLLQNYFLDSTYQVIDSLFVDRKVISPGELNGLGRIENPYAVGFSIEYSGEKLENLKRARYAKPVFILNTTDQERVKIYSDTRIRFKVNGDFKVYLPND